MKLILENMGGCLYAYRETKEHFKRAELERIGHGTRIRKPGMILDSNCDLQAVLKPGRYMVFDIKK